MARAYYGSRIGENTTKTPEGFRVCHNVPIARTGWQEYLDHEIGLENPTGQKVQVYRSEEEVFSPATIASFEGKSVTDGHPPTNVTADNYASYEKGHVENVHRGTGDQADMLMADLIIKDPVLQSKIEAGTRELSCGYECVYEPIDGGYAQRQIRGNHVAVVDSGRAGSRVRINDQKTIKGGKKKMALDKNTLLGKMFKAFAADAEPEEVAAASKMMHEPDTKDDNTAEPNALEERLAKLEGIVKQLVAVAQQAQKPEEPEADALDELLEGPDKDPEKSNTVVDDEEPEDKSDKKEEPELAHDTAVAVIRAIKPAVASIKDPAERKRVSDSLAAVFRQTMRKPPAPATKDDDPYKAFLQLQTKDAKPEAYDPTAFGKNCMKYNPHYKGGK